MKKRTPLDTSKYNELAPDFIIDTFYIEIKKRIENKTPIESYVSNLVRINGKVPKHIQELIDNTHE